ncbi:hypothetical protein [Granulicella arctica]|uniref:hypothetical protein n=1 Tax=Granulicella arctica TaxID=940613 RepID=UPI0021DF9700|nr:hypothetical protein [Granulicella arctica]
MGNWGGVTRILVDHFFRRFFDNDTLQVEGDTVTTVARAVSIVAAPGLLISFFLQNTYPKGPWMAIEDRYFFVLLSFVVMGAVSIFEWEMLFPDRLDFLILSPLSLKPRQMLAAKAMALVGFLMIFLVSANCFAMVIVPAISRGEFYRHLYAHAVAVLMAGVFASLFFLALGGVLLCVVGAVRFRVIAPVVQMGSVMMLVLLTLQYLRYGDGLEAVLTGSLGMARWMPPLWFLALYERLLHGDAAPAFARELAGYAERGTAVAALVVLVTYPLAWARMRRMAVEGGSRQQVQPARWLAALVHRVVRRPGERAVFHFIGQTMKRNNRYQVYLAIYCGTGLALAVACVVTLRGSVVVLSDRGLHAVMPLLLFWVIAGLRTAFAFPLSLSAGWVFRITGVQVSECTAAARKWVLFCALGVMVCVLAMLAAIRWDARHLLVQFVCGVCLCVVLAEAFFFQQGVPFNRPRMPGRTSLPLMLTLYVGAFPVMILWVTHVEVGLERNLFKLLWPLATVAMMYAGLSLSRGGPEEVEEEMEGYEGEFQLLGLS